MNVWGGLRPPVRGSIIVVAVAALVLGLVWSGKYWLEHQGRVDPGPLPASADDLVGDSSRVTFLTPAGAVRVSLETADRTLRGDDDKSTKAPAGGRLVEVSASDDDHDSTTDPTPRGLDRSKMPSTKLWVRSGGQREQITASMRPGDDRDERLFAFGSREPLVVELEFAGRRQSIDVESGRRTTGSFASLYAAQPADAAEPAGYNSHRKGRMRWTSTLTESHRRVPYLTDLGWAKKGREWLVLTAGDYEVDSFEDGDSTSEDYSITGRTAGSVRVDDGRLVRRPNEQASRSGLGADYNARGAVFDIPQRVANRVQFSVQLHLTKGEDGTAAPKPFTATRAHTVGAAPGAGGDR